MYLKLTSEFIKYLGDQDHAIEDVLAHLVLRVMAPLKATSAFIAKLDNQNSLITIGRYGITSLVANEYEDRFSLSNRLPITDAIHQNQIVSVNTLPEWPKEYSGIQTSPYQTDAEACIAFPIERSGTPIAVTAVFFDEKLIITAEIEIFIQSIASLLSIYLTASQLRDEKRIKPIAGPISAQQSEAGHELTQRQLLILRMISEGRTNIAIGDLLKYSESTIRQETIKIFSKLGCDGRHEASTLYKQEQSKVQAAS